MKVNLINLESHARHFMGKALFNIHGQDNQHASLGINQIKM